jgi:hypothetical protein
MKKLSFGIQGTFIVAAPRLFVTGIVFLLGLTLFPRPSFAEAGNAMLQRAANVARLSLINNSEEGFSYLASLAAAAYLMDRKYTPEVAPAVLLNDFRTEFDRPDIAGLAANQRFVIACRRFGERQYAEKHLEWRDALEYVSSRLIDGLGNPSGQGVGIAEPGTVAADRKGIEEEIYEISLRRTEIGALIDAQIGNRNRTPAEILADYPEILELFNAYAAGSLDAEAEFINRVIKDDQTGSISDTSSLGSVIRDAGPYIQTPDSGEQELQRQLKYKKCFAHARANTYVLAAFKNDNPSTMQQFRKGFASVNKFGTGLFKLAATEFKPVDVISGIGDLADGLFGCLSMSGVDVGSDPVVAEVKKVSGQISQLRDEMHDRFNRIDTRLVDISNQIADVGQTLSTQIAIAQETLDELSRSMKSVQNQLSNFQSCIFQQMSDLARIDLEVAMNGLRYEASKHDYFRYSTTPSYLSYLTTFHTWAETISKDSTQAGPLARDYSDAGIMGELNMLPLEYNINYLSGLLKAKWGLGPLSANRLGNPVVWADTSRAYMQLNREWPWHAARLDPEDASLKDIDDVISTGSDLQRAIGSLSAQSTSAAIPVRNVYAEAIEYYRAKMQAAKNTIAAQQTDWEKANFNIYGATLPPNYVPEVPEVTMLFHGDHGSWMNQPNPPQSFVGMFRIPEEIRWASRLGLGTLALNVYALEPVMSDYIYDFTINSLDLYYAHVRVWVEATYNGIPIDVMYLESTGRAEAGLAYDRSSGTWGGQRVYMATYVIDNWNSGENLVGRNGWWYMDPGNVLSTYEQARLAASAAVDAFMSARKAERYAMVTSDLPAMQELTGAVRLIESYTSLGLPRSLAQSGNFWSLTFGDKRLFDGNSLAYACRTASAATMNTMTPGQYLNTLTNHVDDLSSTLTDVFAGIDAGNSAEVSDVDTTLAWLDFRRYATAKLAANDVYNAAVNTPLSVPKGGVLANDTMQTGITVTARQDGINQGKTGKGGNIALRGDGSFDYTPPVGFTGLDFFTYKAVGTDGSYTLESAPATVYMHVDSSVAGSCGASNGASLPAAPDSDLCTSGTPTEFSGSGPWTWTCSGIKGGADASCTAYASKSLFTLNTETWGTGTGTITGAGISCGQDCTNSYASGSLVILTATPGAGAAFDGWTGCDSISGQNCSVTMTESRTVSATFVNVQAANGFCGPANGQSFLFAPDTGLCASGTPSGLSGSGPWTWICYGAPGGTNESCSAEKTSSGRIYVGRRTIAFGKIKKDAAKTVTVQIRNPGQTPLIIREPTSSQADFSVTRNGCTGSVGPGLSCTMDITFTPHSFGQKTGTISITSSDADSLIKVWGTAPPPIIVAPASVNMGRVPVTGSPATRTVRVKNMGMSDLVISSINFAGDASFSQTNTCEASTVAKGIPCTISVTFDPSVAVSATASLTIVSNDPDPKRSSKVISLKGVGY